MTDHTTPDDAVPDDGVPRLTPDDHLRLAKVASSGNNDAAHRRLAAEFEDTSSDDIRDEPWEAHIGAFGQSAFTRDALVQAGLDPDYWEDRVKAPTPRETAANIVELLDIRAKLAPPPIPDLRSAAGQRPVSRQVDDDPIRQGRRDGTIDSRRGGNYRI